MLDEDIAERALAAAESLGRCVLAEVRLEERAVRHLAFRSGEVSSISSASDGGMNVRVVLREGIGFASSNRLSQAEGVRLARKAFRLARSARCGKPVSVSSEKSVRTDWSVRQRRRLADVSLEERLQLLREVDKAALETKIKVQGRYYELKDQEISGYLVNSEGTRIRSHVPRVVLEAYNIVSSNGETEQSIREWGATGGWEKVLDWRLEEAVAHEVRMLKTMIDKGRRVKPGPYDLICGPEVAGIAAHESCGHPMEADRILGREMSQAGKSFVSPGMLGTRIGSEQVTVIDDPTVPGSYGYYAYDHEGVRARPRYLYKNGVINEFLHNRETAARFGVRSNASSRAESYLREPIARMANTFVAPGDLAEDDLIGSVKEGVLMCSFMEWNIDDKRYNQKYVSREAYFIRNGEIGAPARKVTLEITTPGFWGAVDGVSKKVEFTAGECGKGDPVQGVAVFMGGPMVRLRRVMLR